MLHPHSRPQKSSAEGTMATSMVASTVAFAVALGIPMAHITEVTGLTLTDLLDHDARLSSHYAPAIWRILREAFPEQAISLQMADCVPPSFFGPLAHAARHATSLRAVLGLLVRYRVILSPELQIVLIEAPGEARLESFHPADLEDHGWGSESSIAIGTRFLREVMGIPGSLKGIAFAHAPTGPVEVYERFFGVPVQFQQACNAVILHPELLDLPLESGDSRWFQSIQQHLELVAEKLSAPRQEDGLEKMRAAITRCAQKGVYSAQAVARELGMSLRSLQRLTLAQQTTVHALLDEARLASASQLLTDQTLSVDEIAFIIGFSDESAFRRAFTRWAGVTPSRWRHTQRSGASSRG